MSKKSKITRPNRDPDHYSKRDCPYWWSPEWVRGTTADNRDHEYIKESLEDGDYSQDEVILDNTGSYIVPCQGYGRIYAAKNKKTKDVELNMKSKDGNLTYIKGSIQQEFKRWHEDRQIDYILLGMDPDEILAQED